MWEHGERKVVQSKEGVSSLGEVLHEEAHERGGAAAERPLARALPLHALGRHHAGRGARAVQEAQRRRLADLRVGGVGKLVGWLVGQLVGQSGPTGWD